MKLTVRKINEITRQMRILEQKGIAFTDFDFNMNLGDLFKDASDISDPYDKSLASTIKAFKDKGEVIDELKLLELLEVEHEINIPEITIELLKKASAPLPTSVIAMFSRYIKKESK